MSPNRRLLPAAGLALILLTNAVALGGVAWNRSGEPDSRLVLGERELVLPWQSAQSENSGLSLALQWRCLPARLVTPHGNVYQDEHSPAWLDTRKMAELGFDLRAPEVTRPLDHAPRRREQLAREVWLVLELEGPAYRQALAVAAEEARKAAASDAEEAARAQPGRPVHVTPAHDPDVEGRLFVVDAGLDRAALRARYADRAMYAIVRGRVSPRTEHERVVIVPGADPQDARAIAGGRIDALSVGEVNVPLAWRRVFDGMQPGNYHEGPKPHFTATLAFGQRAEPWVVDARRLPATP
jgi:hypothetical protein